MWGRGLQDQDVPRLEPEGLFAEGAQPGQLVVHEGGVEPHLAARAPGAVLHRPTPCAWPCPPDPAPVPHPQPDVGLADPGEERVVRGEGVAPPAPAPEGAPVRVEVQLRGRGRCWGRTPPGSSPSLPGAASSSTARPRPGPAGAARSPGRAGAEGRWGPDRRGRRRGGCGRPPEAILTLTPSSRCSRALAGCTPGGRRS